MQTAGTNGTARLKLAAPAVLALTAVSLLRYALVGLLLWFGAFKFTAAEARAIEPLLAHSPLLAWLLDVTSLRLASRLLGIAEIGIALAIAARPLAPRLSGWGSLAAIGVFATTTSFLATTPGMWIRVEGLVVPTETGGFLLKDVFLLGAAITTAAEAWRPR